MSKRRLLAGTLLLAYVLSMLSPSSYAAGNKGKFVVSDASGVPGEEIEVAISMEENPGVIAVALDIEYDQDVLKLVDAEDAELLNEPTFSDRYSKNPYHVSWNDALAREDNVETGTLVTLTFEILADTTEDETDITISYDPNNVFDCDLENVSFTVENGSVVIRRSDDSDDTSNGEDNLYSSFKDLDENAWYRSSVEYMLEEGLMNGVSDTEFLPGGTVTRAQFVTILYRIEGSPDVSGWSNPFKDVKRNKWYTDAVIWAANEDVVKGVSENEFAPDAEITREQLATLLFRYDGEWPINRNHLGKFNDSKSISAYAVDAMNWAVGYGIVNGVSANELSPKTTATRAQAAAMLYRYLDPPTVNE